jgi:hypothetical protein
MKSATKTKPEPITDQNLGISFRVLPRSQARPRQRQEKGLIRSLPLWVELKKALDDGLAPYGTAEITAPNKKIGDAIMGALKLYKKQTNAPWGFWSEGVGGKRVITIATPQD